MSRITTLVLDTSKGKPAAGIKIILFRNENEEWQIVSGGITGTDGRIAGLLEKDTIPEPGMYKLKFEKKEYFDNQSVKTLYPFIEINFEIKNEEHYHMPLLLNPFGYPTYLGS
ncbi:MAG: hydroxyisourate hydrolase [Ginsengibacter sp.]